MRKLAQKRCISCMNVIDSPVCPYCGYPVHTQNEIHQLPVGTMLRGRYQVGRVLGQGGFGITYIAWDSLMETVVAVKEFYPGSTVNRNSSYSPTVQCNTTNMSSHYEMSKERFLREAKALVRFRGIPEVVDILDFMEENNTAYIVMEFVRGVDLAKYIQSKGGKLSVEETFRILKPVMQALATVHKGDIVHRDISPDNIILDPMGGAKLLDFGAVRSVEDPNVDKALNKSTEAILKQGFAPLEQYNTRGSLGPWTDEYAMCATVFYCLTGRIPEDASIRVTEGIDPDWNSIPGLPEHQKRALEKGMSVRAKDRYPSIDALIADLFTEPAAQPVPNPKLAAQPEPAPVFVPRNTPVFEPAVSVQPRQEAVSPDQPYTPPVAPPMAAPATPPVTPPMAAPATPPVKQQKKNGKKWGIIAAIAAVLVVAILAGVLLPGMIGGKHSKDSGGRLSDPDGGKAGAEDISQEAGATEAAGPLWVKPEEPVEITWYYVGSGMPENYGSWSEKFNDYVEDKIGVRVNIHCIGWGDWMNVRAVTVQTSEDWDLIFTDSNNYYEDVAAGEYADLTPYLDYVPGLTDLIPQMYLDACKVDGKLYAIPAYKDSSMTDFFVWNKDSVEAYFPEYADAHTLAEAYEGLKKINEATGEIWGVSGSVDAIDQYTHDWLNLGRCGIGINLNGGTEFVAMYEDETLLSQYRILHQMFQEGLINSDAATRSGEYDGPTVVGTAQGWPSAGATTWGPYRGEEVACVQYEQGVVTTSTVTSSMTAINADSENVLACLKFLELVNTDFYVRDMLGYGEEGVQWEYTEAYSDMRVHKINGAPSWTFAAYTQGTFFNWTLTDDVEVNYWVEEVQKQNEAAIPSPALGFHVDTSVVVNGQTVAKHINGFVSTVNEYFNLFASGAADPDEAVAEMMGILRQSDFDAVLAEINRQYAQWLASN